MPDKQIVTCITITKKQLIFPNSLLLLPEIVAHLPEFVSLHFQKSRREFSTSPAYTKPLKAQSWQHVYINTCILVFNNTWPHIDLYTST